MMWPRRTSILTEVVRGFTPCLDKRSDGTRNQQAVQVVVTVQRYTAAANGSVFSTPAACNQATGVTYLYNCCPKCKAVTHQTNKQTRLYRQVTTLRR
jgi:hypothetical protein